ncbi:adenylate/guanylate cyclase domain-containing protein [Aliikangiella maris]|uniref:Adenylate/guanylate cyclase domain-containing protein n=2 Tax=Aliikangiella maris TaxID=3162458 RepID=A0ABV3MNX7_9GAMM
MKITTGRQFRTYVISWFLLLVGIIFIVGGGIIYRQAQNYLLNHLAQDKFELLSSLARIVDVEQHQLITNEKSVDQQSYKSLANLFGVFSQAKANQYHLFSVNQLSANKKLVYAIDNQVAEKNLIQINTPSFNFYLAINASQGIQLFHDKRFSQALTFTDNKKKYVIYSVLNARQLKIFINDKLQFICPDFSVLACHYQQLKFNEHSKNSHFFSLALTENIPAKIRYITLGEKLNLPGDYYFSKEPLLSYSSQIFNQIPFFNGVVADKSNLNLSVPLKNGKESLPVQGYLICEIQQQYMQELLNELLDLIVFGFTLITVLLMLASIFFARKITKPLERLSIAIDKLIKNDFNFKLSAKGFGSFRFIAQQFNLMIYHVHTSRQALIKTNKAYSRFVPHQLLKQLSESGVTDISLGDCCERDMTVLFCDIRGFTTLSETMSPQANFLFINRYLKLIAPVINRRGGIIDKYLGDGIMALFPNGADDALKAAIEMLEALEEYNQILRQKKLPIIEVGLGLHSGKMMLGTVGTHSRMDATVISDTVNAAARVESMTKVFKTRILITEETRKRLQNLNDFQIRFIATCRIQGKYKQVTLYEVFDNDPLSTQKEKQSNQYKMRLAWNIYKNGDAISAIMMYQKIIEKSPDDMSLFALIECCEKGRI